SNCVRRFAKLPPWAEFRSCIICDDRGDAFGGVAVPEGRYAAGLLPASEDAGSLLADAIEIAAHQNVGSHLDRDPTFGALPDSETRHIQERGLFLDSAGVGQN